MQLVLYKTILTCCMAELSSARKTDATMCFLAKCTRHSMGIWSLCGIAILFRVGLMAFSIYQDAHFGVKFTDIDYKVFTDAARHVAEGGSPYERATYRYTPLLALLLTPNIEHYESFGKAFFCLSDIVAGALIYAMQRNRGLPACCATDSASVWLLNPVNAIVSARGNAESLLSTVILGVVYFLSLKQLVLAAFLFGFAVHFKIYPIIYALPLYLVLDGDYDGHSPKTGLWAQLRPNLSRFTAVAVSIATFAGFTYWMYERYGDRFLDEWLFYHVTRKDNRHNFSLYFLPLYLSQGADSKLGGLLPFVPQLGLTALVGWRFSKELPLALFLQTLVFVTYNKVCTSQYFLWYLCLLPLVVSPGLTNLGPREGLTLLAAWAASQGIWLFFAYLLEHQSQNTLIPLWAASALFFCVNNYIIVRFIRMTKETTLFANGTIAAVKVAGADQGTSAISQMLL